MERHSAPKQPGSKKPQDEKRPQPEKSGEKKSLFGRVGKKEPRQDDRTRIRQAVGAPEELPPEKPPKGRIKASTVVGRVILNMFKAGLVVFCLALIVGSLVAVQVVEYVVEATQDDENILNLDEFQLSQTSYFMALNPDNPNAKEENDYIEFQELVGAANRVWVNYYDFPDDIINAVVATEDQEFYEHHGINFRRSALALFNDVLPGVIPMTGGASTVTQQLVKNLTGDDVVSDEGSGAMAGYERKIREMFRAWGLENRYSKTTIMESYLNTMSLSGQLAGVEAGARNYFGKKTEELELHESAMIAGITRAPGAYNPYLHPEECKARRDRVLGYMLDCEYITQKQHDEAVAKPLGLVDKSQVAQADEAVTASKGVYTYAVDKAYRDVIVDLMEEYGITREEANIRLQNRGYRIYMTVDLNVQAIVDNLMVTGYDEGGYFMDTNKFGNYMKLAVTEDILNDQGQKVGEQQVLPQVAVVIINYDGELVATSGGVGEKTDSLTLNRSIDSVRQVGSTMKPVAAYALGIDYGLITYSRMVPDTPVRAKDPYVSSVKNWPSNFNKRYRKSGIPIVSAIAESTNTVAAQVGMYVGIDAMYEFLTESLQISSLVEQDKDLGPLVLGSQTYGISPYEMAGAYMMFGGNDTYGQFIPLHSYVRVEDSQGNIVLEPDTAPIQAIDPQTGYVMNRLLYNVVHTGSYPGGASPTAGGMAIGPNNAGETMDSGGKTGTTSDDKDRWFLGITPYYVTAVWWGYDMPDLPNHNFGDSYWSPAARTNIPVNTWKTLIEEIQADMPYKSFPAVPEGIEEARFCTSSGNLAAPGCPSMVGYYTSFGKPSTCLGHADDRPAEEEAPPAE